MVRQCTVYSSLDCQCSSVSVSVLLVILVVSRTGVVFNVQDWAVGLGYFLTNWTVLHVACQFIINLNMKEI